MTLQRIINSGASVGFTVLLARSLSQRGGQRVARFLGNILGSLGNSGIVRAVRANQWVAGGCQIDAKTLAEAGKAVFRAAGMCLYAYYHDLDSPEALAEKVVIEPSFREVIERSQAGRSGQLLVTAHYSNFDYVGRAAAMQGLRMQVLSYAHPRSGYQIQNHIRAVAEMEVTPISPESMRAASRRLAGGGTVLTAVDRPVGEPEIKPVFFGRPSWVPTGYLRLALHAKVPLVVISEFTRPDGRYQVSASEPIALKAFDDRETETLYNARLILERLEGVIRQQPEQWLMYYPVWPDAMEQYPR